MIESEVRKDKMSHRTCLSQLVKAISQEEIDKLMAELDGQ